MAQLGQRQIQELGRNETEDIWNRSGEISKNYPYEHTNRESLKKQLDEVGEALIRKNGDLFKDLRKNPLPDHDMMEMNRGYFKEGLSPEQKKWFDEHGGIIHIKRRPLTS